MSEIDDIIVTLPKGDYRKLEKKIKALDNDREASWFFPRLPLRIDMNSKIYLIYENQIIGYFTILSIRPIRIMFKQYIEINPVKMRGFMGFRYKKDLF